MRCSGKLVTLVSVALVSGCGGSSSAPTAPIVVAAAPTPPVRLGAPAGFAVQTAQPVAASMTLPAGGGFSGTLTTGATVQPYAQVTTALQDAAPPVAPLAKRRAPKTLAQGQTLVYLGLQFDAVLAAGTLGLTLAIPPDALVAGAKYYLALWDPERPSLGWQQGFAGPAVVTPGAAPTLAFTTNAPSFDRFQQYWIAAYMLPSSVPAPTPAPSISPVATPSPVPQSLTMLQTRMSRDSSCSGTPCATGPIASPQPAQFYTVTTGVASPSLSGSSTQLTLYPYDSQAGDVLYYTPSLGEFPTPTNFVWDFFFMIDQAVWKWDDTSQTSGGPLGMQALEFDFNHYMPGYNYNFSSQCFIQETSRDGGPQWQIWGQKTGTDGQTTIGWIPSGMACAPWKFTPLQWHHVTWTYRLHPDTLQTEYVSLKIDNDAPMTPNPSPNPVVPDPKQKAPAVVVQFQQDARAVASPAPFNEWVDLVTLTSW